MSALSILLASAAVWRLTHLLHAEAGPYSILERARVHLRQASLSGPIDCFYCLSLWVAAIFALALTHSLEQCVLITLAFSCFAILINRVIAPTSQALYFEQPEIPQPKETTPCPAAEIHVLHK